LAGKKSAITRDAKKLFFGNFVLQTRFLLPAIWFY